jgi:hypothetical protein
MGHVLLTPCMLVAGVRDMGHVLLTPCMLVPRMPFYGPTPRGTPRTTQS